MSAFYNVHGVSVKQKANLERFAFFWPLARPMGKYGALAGGGNRIRTGDFLLAKQALYQLSYAPGTTNR